MRRLTCAGLVLLLAIAATACLAAEKKSWRLGASYVYPTQGELRDVINKGWGVNVEYSIKSTYYGEMTTPSDISVAANYKHFDHHANRARFYSLGVKYRTGPGACLDTDGAYAGAGIGYGRIKIQDPGKQTENKFQWSLLGGINFAQSWYGELTYEKPGNIQGRGAGNLNLTVGYRF